MCYVEMKSGNKNWELPRCRGQAGVVYICMSFWPGEFSYGCCRELAAPTYTPRSIRKSSGSRYQKKTGRGGTGGHVVMADAEKEESSSLLGNHATNTSINFKSLAQPHHTLF